MSLWQSTMVGLARRKSVTDFMQGNRFTRGLALRFVGGDSASAAICKSVELSARKVTTSLYYLGEYVESPAAIEENVSQRNRVVALYCASHRRESGECAFCPVCAVEQAIPRASPIRA